MLGAETILKICLIACHGGPADHFATYAQELKTQGYQVEVYASGPALQKFQELQINAISFSLDDKSAIEIALDSQTSTALITDVGHPFDVTLQQAFAKHAPRVLRLAYYDNPEPYVPGGYSNTAAQVMLAAQRVLFANSHLARTPIYSNQNAEIPVDLSKRIGIGYYPLSQVDKIKRARAEEVEQVRDRILSDQKLKKPTQKWLVYMGGNNEEYFTKAFPAFLDHLVNAAKSADLSGYLLILQQHPGAKRENRDCALLEEWKLLHGDHVKLPQIAVSQSSPDAAQIAADAIFYYQTSMGPQFVLAGIPTIQIGHHIFEDILVKNHLCSTAINGKELLISLDQLGTCSESTDRAIYSGLGIQANWLENLIRSFK